MHKPRFKRFDKKWLFCSFILFIFYYFMPNVKKDEISYAILATPEKAKFTHFIISLLQNQGVKSENIYIFSNDYFDVDIEGVSHEILPRVKQGGRNELLISNYLNIFNYIFKISNYAVIFEDDIFPGADAVKYFEWGKLVMENDDNVAVISGSNDNSNQHFKQFPELFSKANQFLGLGFMTSKNKYEKIFKNFLIKCKNLPWDLCFNRALVKSKSSSVYPYSQRTLHVPYSKGTSKELVELSLNTKKNVNFPDPKSLKNYRKYIFEYFDWIKQTTDLNEIQTKYKQSHLTGHTFGLFEGISLFPTKNQPILYFEKY